MWQFICGFGSGIYVGTIYNCRPCLKTVEKFLKENLPKEKTDDDNEKGKNDEKQWKTMKNKWKKYNKYIIYYI